jgi:hypothetical protein
MIAAGAPGPKRTAAFPRAAPRYFSRTKKNRPLARPVFLEADR